MRLHQLRVTGFGPFAGTVEVDFEALSDAGLFLLCGPTGAGKTSVLDAICFALYGEVPGDRGQGRRLRCDTADPAVATEVTLDVSMAGRTFRLTRSPAWDRPKRRGTGTTTQPAGVLLQERADDGWTHLTSRIDEAGHLVSELLGMNMSQFCQVAMLPQGRFHEFLRARSEDRQRLLQKLFRTGRFEDIERWLRDHRSTTRRESERLHKSVADQVSRVSEAAGEELPDQWQLADLTLPAESGAVATWAAGLATAASELAFARERAADEAATAELLARTTLDKAVRLADRQARYAQAAAELAGLEAEAESVRRDRGRLDAARAAAPVRSVLRLAEDADAAAARAAERTARTTQPLAERLGVLHVDTDLLDAELTTLRTRLDRARRAADEERSLAGIEARVAAGEARLAGQRQQLDELATRIEELPAEAARARDAVAEAAAAGQALTGAEQRLRETRAQQDAAERAATLAAELAGAETVLVTVVAAGQDAKEAWLAVREARLNGMAAEIAGALAVGQDCPVCGSAEHPHLAVAAADAPDAAAERAARRVVDDAEAARHAHETRVRDLATQLALAREAAGEGDDAGRAAETQDALAERDRLTALAATLAERQHDQAAAETSLAGVLDQRAAAEVETARLEAELELLGAEADRARLAVGEALGSSGHATVGRLVASLAETEREIVEAATALAASARAYDTLASTRRGLEQAVEDAGFASLPEVQRALLPPDQLGLLDRGVREYEERRAAAAAALADPELAAAADLPAPDTDQAAAQHQAAAHHHTATRAEVAVHQQRAARLTGLERSLAGALAAWAPTRAAYAVADRVATFAEGRSPDNALRMRLSAYVLGYRLGQVVDAANHRLARMSDQRYRLEHTAQRGVGESRGGLSLLVRDEWSGEARDPVTLSGGETFVVSLALALGLADVVTQEAGGADIDTLFVDEGFGSLDADTLDDVMDTLDSLREGGRVVGLVSHVPELRTRITTQLHVDKRRTGSTLSLHHASA
ncbi:AAA family ATPase [Nocardioides speluncae]|uniref:AAA family ATPase n=1 Tax=Nocardioides speluncae TaxID=2670337 RepID=UPI000D696A54|nr:SMC family ATPase [Nocardioides speluncae]